MNILKLIVYLEEKVLHLYQILIKKKNKKIKIIIKYIMKIILMHFIVCF